MTPNILTNTGYISIDTLKNWLGIGKPILQTFKISLIHNASDADTGKQFSISNFPTNCVIREIRLRSNFTAGLQPRQTRCTIMNPTGLLPTDTQIKLDTNWINSFAIGDYVFLEDENTEIAYISDIDNINNMLVVTRGVKGTVPAYHDYNTSIEIANSGLRLIIFKNSQKRYVDIIKSLHMLMTSSNIIKNPIVINDQIITFTKPIHNVGQYDLLYINDSNPESVSVENVNNIVKNTIYNNTIFVADPMRSHVANTEVQKQNIYDIPISYYGDSTLYCVIYVDEKIDSSLYPSGVTIDIEFTISQ